jgi:biotin carboxyl carrier protein
MLKHNYEDQSYVVKVNGNISTIRIIKPAEKIAEKIGINKNTSLNVNTLKAPMPGLILEILVSKSVTVKKGDPIIILEAMKMENILTSPIDGVIKNIEVKPQQTVEKNNVLIRFES